MDEKRGENNNLKLKVKRYGNQICRVILLPTICSSIKKAGHNLERTFLVTPNENCLLLHTARVF